MGIGHWGIYGVRVAAWAWDRSRPQQRGLCLCDPSPAGCRQMGCRSDLGMAGNVKRVQGRAWKAEAGAGLKHRSVALVQQHC